MSLPGSAPQTGAVQATGAAPSQETVAALLERITRLEAQVAELRAAAGSEIPRDVLLAISAAVAAYLGKKATIKQIRLAGNPTWASVGRAYVQGSHSRRL
jgi:methylmalonyl-CoA carboxyltransferase large subunit